MKQLLYLSLAALAVITIAFNISGTDQAGDNQINSVNTEEGKVTKVSKVMSSELIDGIDKVLASLHELRMITEQSPEETAKINNTAKKLEENWDIIEKQVEKQDKESYEDIERSLYPLIAEAKKDEPNVVMVKQLVDDSTKKIKAFKNTLGS